MPVVLLLMFLVYYSVSWAVSEVSTLIETTRKEIKYIDDIINDPSCKITSTRQVTRGLKSPTTVTLITLTCPDGRSIEVAEGSMAYSGRNND